MTLIELITVMGIMVIIVSAIVVAYIGLQRHGQIKGTEGLFENLAVGLAQYRVQHRTYVWQPSTILTSDPYQVQASTHALWMALEHDDHLVEVPSENKAVGGSQVDTGTGAFQQWYYYRDAWRQPVLYECFVPYTRFTLRSSGPDLVFGTGDDIVKE